MARILIVDDDPQMLSFLKDAVIVDGHQPVTFSHPLKALEECLKWEEAPDLAILDQQMPELDGIELLRRLKFKWEYLPTIMVTAYGSISSAVEAMKKGAFDYLTKPFKLADLKLSITRALELSRLARENLILRQEIKKNYAQGGLIGKSKAMRELMELVARVAPAQSSVLITGESGTGKEVVAKTIHQLSPRHDKPFVAINCSAIPENLLESELFGHAKGSFTGAERKKQGLFEEAQGGTLFLDEIGDMDLLLQAKLLRVLQERKIRPVGENKDIEIDVRIIAATHKDLKKAIKEGLFREDLYYRLNVIPVHVPPLRFRKEDIPLLAQHFLTKYATINRSPAREFSPDAMLLLMNRTWPGNVRELENLVERMVVLAQQPVITQEQIPSPENEEIDQFFASAAQSLIPLDELEKRYIQFVLTKTGGKKDKTAQILGINRRTLYRKEREYGWISEDQETPPSEEP